MRVHVGWHVLTEGLFGVCGYCGLNGCSITLNKGKGRGKHSTKVPYSNCKYYVKFSLKASEKSTQSGPCTNRPIVCPVCDVVHWSYNLEAHMVTKHPEAEAVNCKIEQGEVKLVTSKKIA